MTCFRPSQLVRGFAGFGSTGSLGLVGSGVGLIALLVACADLHAPRDTGAAGGTSGGYGGGSDAGKSDGAGGSTTGQGGGIAPNGGADVGIAGSSSEGGTAGASAQAGSGGTMLLGASGQAGTSGSSGGETGCARRDGGDIQAWLYQEITTDQSNELHPFFALTTTGLSLPLKQLAIRYYFSGEMSGDWQLTCIWVTKDGGTGSGLCDEGVSMQIVAMDPPRPQADQYLEISFAGVENAALSEGFPVEARSMFWRAAHPMLNQTNDYSFLPTLDTVLELGGRSYEQTSKVTVYRNGELVWGEEPCP